MALIVEDGTGKSDADSYCSLAFADAYCTARNVTSWTGSDAHKNAALIRATDHLGQSYRYLWAGYRKTESQALDWPRHEVPRLDMPGTYWQGMLQSYYSADVVPIEVQKACVELAVRSLGESLAPDVSRIKKREKVDVIEVEYADGASPWVRFRAVDNLLAGLLKSSSGSAIQLVRA